jgi:cytochrome c peroxidase
MWSILLLSALAIAALPLQAGAGEAPRLRKSPLLPERPYSYAAALPPHLAGLAGGPGDKPVTNAGATLGRVLFHDRQLSRNGLVACASCHTQAFGFDDRTRLSIGFEGKTTRRAAMSLTNARFAAGGRYFRDLRATTLEEQVLEPFTDPVEMGLGPGDLVRRVEGRAFYPPLFQAAFGDPAVSEEKIASALAQYVRAIVSTGSRYDEGRAGAASPLEPFGNFSDAENRGKQLFFTAKREGGAGCAQCHSGDGFLMPGARNNGLEVGSKDNGLGEITGRREDMGLFRAASLKNIAVSTPYMHDGRLATLADVVRHYSQEVRPHPNLSPELRKPDGNPARLDLSVADEAALVAFLETLSDAELLVDPRFSDPFLSR